MGFNLAKDFCQLKSKRSWGKGSPCNGWWFLKGIKDLPQTSLSLPIKRSSTKGGTWILARQPGHVRCYLVCKHVNA